MKQLALASLATIAIASPFAAYSHDRLQYDYVEGGIADTSLKDGTGESSDTGTFVNGSLRLSSNIFFRGEVESAHYDDNIGSDSLRLAAGIGFRKSVTTEQSTPTDIYAIVGVEKHDLDSANSIDYEGYHLAVGLRFLLTATIELYGEGQYRWLEADSGMESEHLDFSLGLLIHVARNFAVNVKFSERHLTDSVGDKTEMQTWSLGGRLTF